MVFHPPIIVFVYFLKIYLIYEKYLILIHFVKVLFDIFVVEDTKVQARVALVFSKIRNKSWKLFVILLSITTLVRVFLYHFFFV